MMTHSSHDHTFLRAAHAGRSAVLARCIVLLAAGILAPQGTLRAQAGAAAPAATTGIITGVAEDSLHGGALPGATVQIRQLPGRNTRTGASGSFTLDAVPAGRYTLELLHPVIDSLGIRVLSDTVTVAAGATQQVALAVPSAERIVAAVCPAIRRRLGPGAIIGRVDDAVTGKPATGATVSAAWTETEVGTTIGVRSAPRLRKDVVAADGTYRICGVPSTLTATLQAQRGAARTAEVPLETTEEPLVVRVLHLPPPPVAASDSAGAGASQPRAARALITGKVTNAGGVPVADARVTVQGSNAGTSTASDGSFTLTGVPPGTQAVLVRRVGYAPVELPLDVKAFGSNTLTVRLGAYTPQLSQVEVKAKAPDMLESTGFTRRQRMGMGRYMNEEQITETHPTYTTDVLRRIPGLYVSGQGASAGVYTTRGYGCVRYLIDRNPVQTLPGQSIDQLVNVQDITAIEFYNESTIPLELSSGPNSGCALLAIWTKGSLKNPTTKR